jgi:phosphoribosylanthranilate isomerase
MQCRVKICGVTSVADARAAAELGADVLGLNFYERSPRSIDETTAREILTALPSAVEAVALSVNETWPQIVARVERLPGLFGVQVHHSDMTPCPAAVRWTPAFAVKDADSLRTIAMFLDRCRQEQRALPAAILVDAHVPGQFGGTGQVAPWDLLADFDPGVPLILAGGLTPDNVADAIRRVRPAMVDVASGVEQSPGQKDVDKMKRFIDAVRTA